MKWAYQVAEVLAVTSHTIKTKRCNDCKTEATEEDSSRFIEEHGDNEQRNERKDKRTVRSRPSIQSAATEGDRPLKTVP